jgi:cytochrome b involved in lipid metabolism
MFEFILSIFKKIKCQHKQRKPIYCKINDCWYDIRDFADLHPGGAKFLEKFHLEDITERFYKISYHEYVDLEKFEKYKVK